MIDEILIFLALVVCVMTLVAVVFIVTTIMLVAFGKEVKAMEEPSYYEATSGTEYLDLVDDLSDDFLDFLKKHYSKARPNSALIEKFKKEYGNKWDKVVWIDIMHALVHLEEFGAIKYGHETSYEVIVT